MEDFLHKQNNDFIKIEHLFTDTIKYFIERYNIQTNEKELIKFSSDFIGSIESGEEDKFELEKYFLNSYNLPRLTSVEKRRLIYLLYNIYSFQNKIYDIKENIYRYRKLQNQHYEEHSIDGDYDLVFTLLLKNILLDFEDAVEIYTKCFEGIYGKKVLFFNEINLLTQENLEFSNLDIFQIVNLLRKLIAHSNSCFIKKSELERNDELILSLKKFSIQMNNNLKLYFDVYEKISIESNNTDNLDWKLYGEFNITIEANSIVEKLCYLIESKEN